MVIEKVSVILPAYNAEKTIQDAIQSILNQSYSHIEVVIIDDGSIDNTKKIIQSIKDQRIRFISRENKGLGNTLNELIDLASYDLIARMDADDIAHIDRIKLQVEKFQSNPELSMLGGQINFLVNDTIFNRADMPLDHKQIRRELMNGRFPICHPAIMFRKDFAKQVGSYRVGGAGEDLDFFLRMSEIGEIANLSEKILTYRMELNSLSSRKRDDLNKGYAFAIYNAHQRISDKIEIDHQTFDEKIWSRRSIKDKFLEKIHSTSERFYRTFYYHRSKNNYLLALLDLIIVCSCRPRSLFLNLKSRFFGVN